MAFTDTLVLKTCINDLFDIDFNSAKIAFQKKFKKMPKTTI